MTDEETRNSQYWEERSEELSTDELKSVSGGVSGVGVEIPRVTNRQKKGRKKSRQGVVAPDDSHHIADLRGPNPQSGT